MKKIKFDCEVITPMFLGGAEQQPELRPPSIRGAMRWWFRAMMGAEDVGSLSHEEGNIFGSVADDGKVSNVSIRIIKSDQTAPSYLDLPNQKEMVTSKSRGRTFPINLLDYLAYGPVQYDKTAVKDRGKTGKNIVKNGYLTVGSKFSIVMTFRYGVSTALIEHTLKSFILLSTYGGIGSKSRNGYGSIDILNMNEIILSMPELDGFIKASEKDQLNNLILKTMNGKSYPSFSSGTRLFKLKNSYNTWDQALGELARKYRNSRIKIEQHDVKKRQFIGSPLTVDNKTSLLDRHSKPYFLKIRRINGKYYGFILHLSSHYCDGMDGNMINHGELDREYLEVCNEFNRILSQEMEAII